MPFTHLGRVRDPPASLLGGSWNYWWQAHYVDSVVDAGLRCLRQGDTTGAGQRARLGSQLVRGILVRNGGRFRNAFYDDMAWLALAVHRLRLVHEALGRPRPGRQLRTAERVLTAALRSAMTDDLGGGLFWNTRREFKNVPATGPAALHLARIGDVDAARRLVDWVYARLRSPDTGLLVDGIRVTDGREHLVADVYTYNQGTVLGALVTLGDDSSLGHAAELVDAVAAHLTTIDGDRRPLVTHGGGDGGLFTGILVRYLALVATHPDLGAGTRDRAARLVHDTADGIWVGRREHRVRGDVASVFPVAVGDQAREAPSTDGAMELSTQLQAWMVLEAAAVVG